MEGSMIQEISNRGGEYTSPSLLLMEVSAETGFATSNGISTSDYEEGVEF